MKKYERSPLIKLAIPRFRSSFQDLLSSRANISYFDRNILEATFERIMWFGRSNKDYTNFERSARAAYHFLEKGNQIKPRDLAQSFYSVVNRVTPAINSSIFAYAAAEKLPKNEVDSKIKNYLEYYKVMYEGLLPLICAPVIHAFGISKNIKDKAFIPQADGKADLKAITKMEKWLIYPENRLAIGLNSHVRNAYAHENVIILDNAQFKIWDYNIRKPHLSWGPEIWQLDQLMQLCDQLWVNALGIICSLIIYHINNQLLFASHGWIPPTEPPQLRAQELNAAVDSIVNQFGFYLKSIDSMPQGILTCPPKTIPSKMS